MSKTSCAIWTCPARNAIPTHSASSKRPPATADVYLPIPAGGMGSLLRLSRAPEMVALGRQAAETALPAIREALASVAAPLWGHGEPV